METAPCVHVVSMDSISEEYWIICDTHYKWIVNMGSTPEVSKVVKAIEGLKDCEIKNDRSV